MAAAPTRIWLEISHHTAFRVGGWAFVRQDGSVSGYAGGTRRLDLERTALSALVAALKTPCDGPVEIRTSSAAVAAIPERIAAAQAGEAPPSDNLDLWAQATTLLGRSGAQVVRAQGSERPLVFAAAWAEFGRDKAKDKGPFESAIPKPNLAKAGLPDSR
jgi:hypothetical protein